MKVLVTGAAGMLGRDVTHAFRQFHQVLPVARLALDVCNRDSIQTVFRDFGPDLVVHCAAMTDVDGCERDPDSAYLVNTLGSWLVAEACRDSGAAMCYVSTDYVFDGTKGSPYDEFDTPNPLGIYGRSKLAGEMCLHRSQIDSWIIRTSWLFGDGKCFPKTILNALETRGAAEVVDNQFGCPTYTADLAEKMREIVEELPHGVYHVCNVGSCSWYEFAEEIAKLTGKSGKVKPISSEDWPTPTQRPQNSRLRQRSLEMLGRDNMRPWQDALSAFLAEIKVAVR